MVFRFGKHELTPTIEELESFLNLKHRHHADAIFPGTQEQLLQRLSDLTLNVSKNFLPKETLGDYLHCPFDLLLDRGWKKVRDFSNPAKYRAFILTSLGLTPLIS